MIQAAANAYSLEYNAGDTQNDQTISVVPTHFWLHLSGSPERSLIWQTGNVRFFLKPLAARIAAGQMSASRYINAPHLVAARYFGVRFNPSDLDEWLRDLDPPTPAPLVATQSETQMPPVIEAPSGPRVPEAHLQAWYDVYRQAYTGAHDTEDMAMKSATGMFPGKSVARDRIRKLRGTQKRGRKPRDQDA